MRQVLLRKEIGELLRSRQVMLLLAVALVLACAGFLNAAKEWTARRELLNALYASNQEELRMASSWGDVASIGILVRPEVSAGAYLFAPRPWPAFVVRHPALPVTAGGASCGHGSLAPGAIVAYFFTLLAVLASFDAISGERARRTLALLLAVAGSRREVLAAKIIARVMVVGGGTALALLAGAALTTLLQPSFAADPSFLPAAAVLTVGGVLLTCVFVVIGVALSVSLRDPLTALLAGVGVWVAVLVALPGTLGAAARLIAPPPSRALLRARADLLYTQAGERMAKRQMEPIERWMREGPSAQAWAQNELDRIRKEENQKLARELSALEAEFRRREELSRKLAAVATGWLPQALFERAVLAAAGRDDDSWARYLDAVHAYWQEFSDMTGSRVKTVELLTPGQSDPFAATRPKLDQVPAFRYQPAPQPLLRVLPKLAGILVWGTIALITTMRRFAGVDPR